ncbi:MAG: lysophospholipid acyltransferase family protein [Candidatus Omnitrophica bacterium]|nr:lysophospholipid acyltransferase family protein [Candidatus Omnitrophota bacterium]
MSTPPTQEKFLNRLSNRSLHILKWTMLHLPFWIIALVFKPLFLIAVACLKKQRKICEMNLHSVYLQTKTPQEYKAMAKACIRDIGHSMMDMLFYVNRPNKLNKIAEFYGEEHLKAAMEKGKGVIGVTAHLGNFPLLFLSLVQKGYKVNVIIRPMRNKNFSEFMFDLCAQWKINMIQTFPTKVFLKETLGALKRNELLFILLDEEAKQEAGVMVDFLNNRVSRAIGPLLFHKRTDSSILPIFIIKENKNFKIFIEPTLEVETKYSAEENDQRNISALTRVIESFVKQYPKQWGGWLNKRWTESNQPPTRI